MNTTILNMLARVSVGMVSTIIGSAVGKKVADHTDSTAAAVTVASVTTAGTFIVANKVCSKFLAKTQDNTEDDESEVTFVEEIDDDPIENNESYPDLLANFHSEEDVSIDDVEDGNEFPSLLSSLSSDEPGDEPVDDADNDESNTDEINASADEASDDTGEEDPLRVKAMDFLKMTGGDPSIVGGINATMLKECLDAMLTDSTLYKAKVCEDDGRTYLSGPWVDLIEEIASIALICPSGKCNWDAHDQLAKLSSMRYFVTPGETDSFGWLTGCINTPAGIIVYG